MNLLLVLAALAMVGELNLIGRLTGTEVILTGCAVMALIRCPRPSGNVRRFYIFALLWFCAAVASDLYNGSSFDNVVRGWAKIGFFVLNFTALRWLIGNNLDRAVVFNYLLLFVSALRLALGAAGGEEEELGVEMFGDAWKFGYGQFASASALLASAYLLRNKWLRPVAVALPFGAAAAALLVNARNLTGITVLAGLVSTLTAGRRRPLAMSHLLSIGVAVTLAGVLVINVYHYTASEGLLGRAAQDKYISQTQGGLGLVLGGRSESLASIPAIIDSPVLGHGSWARNINYVLLYLTERERAGFDVQGPIHSDLIPSHSYVLGAWVEHGILGAAFWVWALFVTVKGLIAAVRRPSPMTGIIVFVGLSLLWDIPFSPFGLERRIFAAVGLYLMILVTEQAAAATAPSPVRRRWPPVFPRLSRLQR